jgi:hypothetical protein
VRTKRTRDDIYQRNMRVAKSIGNSKGKSMQFQGNKRVGKKHQENNGSGTISLRKGTKKC